MSQNTIPPLSPAEITPPILAALNSRRTEGLEFVEGQSAGSSQLYIHQYYHASPTYRSAALNGEAIEEPMPSGRLE